MPHAHRRLWLGTLAVAALSVPTFALAQSKGEI